ncbi:hypothetical protein YC2023_025103 [Brassica napus]
MVNSLFIKIYTTKSLRTNPACPVRSKSKVAIFLGVITSVQILRVLSRRKWRGLSMDKVSTITSLHKNNKRGGGNNNGSSDIANQFKTSNNSLNKSKRYQETSQVTTTEQKSEASDSKDIHI